MNRPPNPNPASDNRCHILIVEDDADIREALTQFLEGDRFRVTTTSNGHEALEFLKTHLPPAVILLDLMMPVMDGWTFRRETKKDAILGSIPVVIISAGSDLRKVASDLDAFSFVTKPIDGDELIAVLSEACCQSQRLRLQFGSDEVK